MGSFLNAQLLCMRTMSVFFADRDHTVMCQPRSLENHKQVQQMLERPETGAVASTGVQDNGEHSTQHVRSLPLLLGVLVGPNGALFVLHRDFRTHRTIVLWMFSNDSL